jgi:transposase-like protein
VLQEAYVHGVSTRKVDVPVKALGLDGISKSEVSQIYAEIDAVVEALVRQRSSASRSSASRQAGDRGARMARTSF